MDYGNNMFDFIIIINNVFVGGNKMKPLSEHLRTIGKIVKEKQYRKIEGILVDMQTANLVIQFNKKLSEKNRIKYLSMPLDKALDFSWRLYGRLNKNALP